MFAGAVPGTMEHRRRWRRSAERGIVLDVCPDPAGVRFTGGQNRNCRIVAMNSFGCKRMGLNPLQLGSWTWQQNRSHLPQSTG